jgi:hypothetical protein
VTTHSPGIHTLASWINVPQSDGTMKRMDVLAGYQARCDCGWQGPTVNTRTLAGESALAHIGGKVRWRERRRRSQGDLFEAVEMFPETR